GLVVDEFSAFIDPGFPLDPFISNLTGITNDMLFGQPDIDEVIPAFAEFVGDAIPVAHNATFDGGFLRRFWKDDREWLDTLVLAKIAFPCLGSYSLANITAHCGVENSAAHRAINDAQATAEVFLRMLKELRELPLRGRQDILTLAEGDTSVLAELLRRECALSQLPPPLQMAEEPRRDRGFADEFYELPLDEIEASFSADGIMAERLSGYEHRHSQQQMAVGVARAFNNREYLLAEAGTGTGKSLAYLLPAVRFAPESRQTVGVSTHTKNLQEQLLNKDIPMLQEVLQQPIEAAVLKGRSNYICRRMYRTYLHHPHEDERYFLMRVASWLSRSETGDGGEMPLVGYDKRKWQYICGSKENCHGNCPYAHGGCYVTKARRAAENADILILNHSLLLANSAAEQGFLPRLPYLIIDEAQHLERTAEDQLSSKVDFYDILMLLGRLKRHERGRSTGVLEALYNYKDEAYIGDASRQMLTETITKAEDAVADTVHATEQFFDMLARTFAAEAAQYGYFPQKLRLLPKHRGEESWLQLEDAAQSLATQINVLSTLLFKLLDWLNAQRIEHEVEISEADELHSVAMNLRETALTLPACLEEDENFVAWVEFPGSDKQPSLNIAPIELGELLRENLYDNCESLVLTSATLTAANSFSYFKERCGLDLIETTVNELQLASPFDYRAQAQAAVCMDMPDFTRTSEVECVNAISRALIELITASQGRAMVLFTSHSQLRSVYEAINRPLKEQGITVLAHGISGEPTHLLNRLKAEEKCCILGANSFWEGVDVAGTALSLVVVVRLPFWPPNTPTSAARMERIEAAGKSSFFEYSLPQALIRFKQGFGRLIRTTEDSGVFCVLDRRIVDKRYGKSFWASLPGMELKCAPTAAVAELIRQRLGHLDD
ncbi:MAG: hypothetical protein IJF62_00660, partial [Firmicutes bacterium]|nr:hypothetical protein [Bacillota bacterium]